MHVTHVESRTVPNKVYSGIRNGSTTQIVLSINVICAPSHFHIYIYSRSTLIVTMTKNPSLVRNVNNRSCEGVTMVFMCQFVADMLMLIAHYVAKCSNARNISVNTYIYTIHSRNISARIAESPIVTEDHSKITKRNSINYVHVHTLEALI
jgi:hypothetical protein